MPYQKLSISTGYILCYKVSGTVTSDDYTELLVPDVDRAYQSFGKVRILLDITDFRMKDMQWTAMWQDAKFGMKMERIEKFALICHHQIIAYAIGFLLGSTYQPFSSDKKESAFEWIFEGSSFRRPQINFDEIKSSESSGEKGPNSKYLIALDSAEPARSALSQAMHLVGSGDSNDEIHLMTVITDDSDPDLLKKTLEEAASLVLSIFSKNQRDKINTFEHIVNSGGNKNVAKAILDVAKEIEADYIILGTKNATNARSFSDSVCLEVISSAKCPVLVCKAGQDAPGAVKLWNERKTKQEFCNKQKKDQETKKKILNREIQQTQEKIPAEEDRVEYVIDKSEMGAWGKKPGVELFQ